MSCPCGDVRYVTCVGLNSCGFKGESQWFSEVHEEASTAKLDRGSGKGNGICKRER